MLPPELPNFQFPEVIRCYLPIVVNVKALDLLGGRRNFRHVDYPVMVGVKELHEMNRFWFLFEKHEHVCREQTGYD